MTQTYLVTGGAGFIGSALVRHLLAETDASVVNVDKLTYASSLPSLGAVEADPRYAFVRMDVRDGQALRGLLDEVRPSAVFHLAAESHVDRSIDGPAAFIETNVLGTFALLEACRAHLDRRGDAERDRFRIVHVSTDEVFGSLGAEGYFVEETPYQPRSPYSASKAASDHLARAWFHTFGLPVIVTNCSNNYGPFQFPEKLIPLMILNALAGEKLPVYGAGTNIRDWLHVEDHVRGLLAACRLGTPGESYNFGGGAERTNLDVVRAICRELAQARPGADYDGLITFVRDRPGHDHRYAIDATRARRELGWVPNHGFEDGLAATVRWYIDNEWWWEPLRSSSPKIQWMARAAS